MNDQDPDKGGGWLATYIKLSYSRSGLRLGLFGFGVWCLIIIAAAILYP